MTPSTRKTFLEIVQIGDVGMLFGCLGIAYALTTRHAVLNLFNSLETRHPIQVFIATLVLAVGWHQALRSNGFYRSHRLDSYLKEILDICSATSLCALFSLIWLWLIRSSAVKNPLSELVLISLFFGVVSFAALLTTRLLGRVMMHGFRARGHNLRHIIIVGTNRRADAFSRDISLHPEWRYNLQGYVDDQWWDEDTRNNATAAMLGGFETIPELLRTTPVDEVIIALPMASFYRQIAEVVSLCRHHGIAVRSIGTFFDQEQSRRTSFLRGTVGVITLHDESWSERAATIKRIVDVIVSAMALFMLSPVLLTVAVLIKLTSPGPIFFCQTRLGYGKRPFKIFKFRTMVPDAEMLMKQIEHLNQTQGPTFKLTNDPRITPLGRFLRKTSLDEIPQLINVLIGDMSLVGPRPLPLRDYEGFSQDWHRRRFSVKPGITCLWQVMGRSSIGFDQWMELDMQYIDDWSVWLDFKIMAQTIPAVLRGSGAV